MAQAPPQPATTAAVRQLGTIKALTGSGFILVNERNQELAVSPIAGARILRTAPGQKDLKDAAPIEVKDLEPGDRALVRGELSLDGKSLTANSVIVMKQSDIAAKRERDREDWQQRGVAGLVQSDNPSARNITVTSGSKTILVETSSRTIIRRYAPDSVSFDEAKPGTFDQIKPGDQLRARGNRNQDGTRIDAEEIVSGAFRNLAGTLVAINTSENSITLKDLASKKPVTVKLAADSELHALSPMAASRLAMRLKGVSSNRQDSTSGANKPEAETVSATAAQGGGARSHNGDLEQMLNRLPAISISDLKQGQAVMVVTTEGTATTAPTVITLLTGVEPLLSASPNDNRAAMLLSPWSLGTSAADTAAQ